MEQKDINAVIEKHLGKIKKNAGAAIDSYNTEAIHKLRINYKKLRALARLSAVEEKIKIPGDLKELYQNAGKLRNLQIYYEAITGRFKNSLSELNSSRYYLITGLRLARKEFTSATKKICFHEVHKELFSQLPDTLPEDAVAAFMEQQVKAVHDLLKSALTDTSIHSIRKHLKDILYSLETLKGNEQLDYTLNEDNIKQLKQVTDAIGSYNDRSVNLSFLKNSLDNLYAGYEKNILEELYSVWLQEKRAEKKKLVKLLNTIKNTPALYAENKAI